MSGTTVAKPRFDKAAEIRRCTVALLRAYGTIAGADIEDWRAEEIGSGDMPRIVVTTDTEYEGVGLDPPTFKVTCTLDVSAYVERAQHEDAVADMDSLVAQIREALFGNPLWVRSVTRIASVKVAQRWLNKAERLVGHALTSIVVNWTEFYRPVILDDLNEIDTTVKGPIGPEVTFVTKLPSAGD